MRFMAALPVVAWVCYRGGTGFGVPRQLWPLLVLNAAMTAVQIATFNWGTSQSEAGRSSVFINVHPLITAPWPGSSWASTSARGDGSGC